MTNEEALVFLFSLLPVFILALLFGVDILDTRIRQREGK